jgi:His/Glu/Gln/Arg/opine family amino acid ABC transporter permease subunit
MTDLDTMAAPEDEDVVADKPRPADPVLPPGEWAKQNLFSSFASSLLTLFFGALAFGAFWGLLKFTFNNPARRWDAVPTNMRLMFTQGYPTAHYARIWVSVGIIMALVGLSLAVFKSRPYIGLRKMVGSLAGFAVLISAGALLIQPPILTDAAGEFVRNADASVQRESYIDGIIGRWWVFAIALVLLGIVAALWAKFGDQLRFMFAPFLAVLYGLFGLVIASLWFVHYGHYGLAADTSFIVDKGSTVAFSTQMPWTVMWALVGIGYLVGRQLPATRVSRGALTATWALSPFFLIWVVLRAPSYDMSHVVSTDLPIFLGFAFVGGAIMFLLTKKGIGELGRLIAFGLLLFAAFHWVAGFAGWYPMLQKARISFLMLALFALAAPNFAGDRKARMSYVWTWVGVIGLLQVFVTTVNTDSTLTGVQGESFIGGFVMTLVLAVLSVMLSFPLGVLLALGRTSTLPIFRVMSTAFIETIRGVPLITVLFFFATILPLFYPAGMVATKLSLAVLALVLFSSAYVAENIRGGLQSVLRGQYEAADAMGLTTAQRTSLIVLPQALRVSIPPLVGQTIATYKETSLIAIIGLFDFLLVAKNVIPAQSEFRSARREALLFVSLIYWVGAYSMSKYSRSLERKLGVGTR